MRQIIFYKHIAKKVIVSGPAIEENQHYKCVVYKSLDPSPTGVISCTAKAIKGQGCPCATVEFEFPSTGTGVGTSELILGDNNLCVFDVIASGGRQGETENTIYKVYEAKVFAEDSYVNHA